MVAPTPKTWRALFEDDAELVRRADALAPERKPQPELPTGTVSMRRWQSVVEAKLWLADRRELAILRDAARYAREVPYPWPGDVVRGGRDQNAWKNMDKALRDHLDFQCVQPGAKVTSWQGGYRHAVGDWVRTTMGDSRVYLVVELAGSRHRPKYVIERPRSDGTILHLEGQIGAWISKVFSHNPHCWVGEDRPALEAWRKSLYEPDKTWVRMLRPTAERLAEQLTSEVLGALPRSQADLSMDSPEAANIQEALTAKLAEWLAAR